MQMKQIQYESNGFRCEICKRNLLQCKSGLFQVPKFEPHLKELSLNRNMHLYKASCQSLKINLGLNQCSFSSNKRCMLEWKRSSDFWTCSRAHVPQTQLSQNENHGSNEQSTVAQDGVNFLIFVMGYPTVRTADGVGVQEKIVSSYWSAKVW